VGTPAASDLTLAPGAGHGDEGDASFQGPAQEEALSAQPKPTNAKVPTNAEAATNDAGSVITLAARTAKPEAVETAARETGGLVMTRPKPEKRKNAKERAKEKYARKDTADGTTPMTAKAKSKGETKAESKKTKKAKKTKQSKAAA
jgi:hypothetical protein